MLKRAWLICHKISGWIGGRTESAPLPHPLYPVLRDLCVTRAAARLNVILSAAKNPKGFIPRQRSFASKGFGFFTSLRSVQNDSKSASADIPRAVTQRSRMTGRAGRSNSRVELGSDGSTVPVTPIADIGVGVGYSRGVLVIANNTTQATDHPCGGRGLSSTITGVVDSCLRRNG